MDLFMNLNPMQKAAVEQIVGPLLILAGAGSGKTRVLTHRIAYMIEKGISPFNILAITFTNKAAKEMRERVDSLCPSGGSVWVSTFHSMCVRILRQHIDKINYDRTFTIYDSDDAERLIKKCIKELDINDKQYPHKNVMSVISSWKDQLHSPQSADREFSKDYRLSKIVNIYELYQQKLKVNNALDFDDIIFKTVELLDKKEDVLHSYQERFKYIMVDEYQDTNTAQYQLISMLCAKYKNLCVVGDDDQSIYGWRGADIRNILEFERDFKNTTVITLEQNYRSTQNILDAANSVIQNNKGRKNKSLWTGADQGEKIFYFRAQDERQEARFIVEKIEDFVSFNNKYGDNAILYRNNALSRAVEEQLTSKKIPYKIFGGVRFYERKEIKDVLAYLRVINNPKDSISLLRIINVPRRGIGDASIDKVYEYSVARDITLFDALNETGSIDGLGARAKKMDEFKRLMDGLLEFSKNHTVIDVIEKTLQQTGYVEEIMAEKTEEALGRIENINEFISKATEFEETAENKSLTSFLEELALVADIDAYGENDDTVVLMTFHSAKGLEFPTVYMVGLEEGIFPSYRSVVSSDPKDLEEERRICYVGITRAMNKLYISSANSRRQHGNVNYNSQSRFLKEISEGLMENVYMNMENKKMKNDETKTERTGISQFAEINKVKNSIDISFGGKNYLSKPPEKDESKRPDFNIGDKVRQMKYGVGVVKDIKAAGADYEVTVEFGDIGDKKFMAHLCKLKKVD